MEAIRDRQWTRSSDGPLLIAPLIEMMQAYFPGMAFDGFPTALVRTLAGDHCADLLELPPADRTRSLISAGTVVGQLLGGGERRDLDSRLIAHATHQLMKAIVQVEREAKQARFRIPVALQQTIDPGG